MLSGGLAIDLHDLDCNMLAYVLRSNYEGFNDNPLLQSGPGVLKGDCRITGLLNWTADFPVPHNQLVFRIVTYRFRHIENTLRNIHHGTGCFQG